MIELPRLPATTDGILKQASMGHVLSRLAMIPRSSRRFDTGEARALREFGFTSEILQSAIDAGLHYHKGLDRVFDERDLHSLSTHLCLNSARRSIMRFWLRTLGAVQSRPAVFTIGITAELLSEAFLSPPASAHGILPWGKAINLPIETGRVSHRVMVEIPPVSNCEITAPSLRRFLSEYEDIEHYFLPRDMLGNRTLFDSARIADCRSFANHMVNDAQSVPGISLRTAFGLLVSTPFSVPHAWVEFETNEGWVPFDWQLAGALRQWGLSNCPRWELALMLPSIFWKWSEYPFRFVQPHTLFRAPQFRTEIGS